MACNMLSKGTGSLVDHSDDYLASQCTYRGPEIEVCAPGRCHYLTFNWIRIWAWDGITMACPHVAVFN